MPSISLNICKYCPLLDLLVRPFGLSVPVKRSGKGYTILVHFSVQSACNKEENIVVHPKNSIPSTSSKRSIKLSPFITGLGVVAVGATLLVAACVQNNPQAPGEAVSRTVTSEASSVAPFDAANGIKQDVSWLADDARQGREAGTQGYVDAANYVASRFQALGLSAGNGDSYLQDVQLRITKRDDASAFMSITGKDGKTVQFTNKKEFLGGRASQGEAFKVTAPLVFAGFGVSGSSYDDYAGLDVDGKIVVVFNGAPRDMNSEERAHLGSGRTKAETAASKGAVGLISVSANNQNPVEAWERGVNFPDGGRWSWVSPDGVANAPQGIAPSFAAGPEGATAIFAGAEMSFADVRDLAIAQDPANPLKGFDLPFTATLAGNGQIEDVSSPNVVGILEGSDPELRNEVLVLTAHLDHVGVHEPRGGGEDYIHNGAMDNAMGVSTLLEVARRFQENGGPRRTVAFVAVTAEEKGLIGSDYFANYPTVDPERIVANVNLDMPLVLYPFTDVIAFGAERSSLGEMVRAAGQKMGVELIADPYPNLSLFTRSDHYNFVRKGIPSVFLFLGTGNGGDEVFTNFFATNYHQPQDEVASLDISWDDAARFAELNYLIAREIADSAVKPEWKEGDFFANEFAGK